MRRKLTAKHNKPTVSRERLQPLPCGTGKNHLGLGLVPGFSGAGRDDRHAVMLGQFLIFWIDVGVVTTGFGDAGLEVVRHQDGTDAAEVTEGPDVA